jgi:phosphosulfolactate synthase
MTVDLPDFLDLPARGMRPRSRGLTHVLDKGLPLATLRSLLDLAGPWIDYVKLGWGTAYVGADLREKVAACRDAGVHVSPGGTLLEIAASQHRVSRFAAWAASNGIDTVEVSDGALDLDPGVKQCLIRTLSRHFIVLSEVGSKDESAPVVPGEWAAAAAADLEAGASYVIVEGRESGTVGLYLPDGSVRQPLVSALLDRVPADKLIFEAPRKSQQAWFVNRLGTEVNVGNIPPDEILGLETLRRGLRADTAWLAKRSWSPSLVIQAFLERSG